MRKVFVWALMVYLLVDCQAGPAPSSTQILAQHRYTAIVEATTSTPQIMPANATSTPIVQTIIPVEAAPPATSPVLPTLKQRTGSLRPPLLKQRSVLEQRSVLPLSGDFKYQILRLEESMPAANSEAYIPPISAEMDAFREMLADIISGEADHVVDLAGSNRYEILRYADRGDRDQESYLLREWRPIQKGWGLYAIRIGQSKDVIVEAPHPLSDEKTPVIAMQIYRALKAHALLIAGANRYADNNGSADVAHNSLSIFQTVHKSLLEQDSPVVLQIHGFATANHPGYPQVILGHDQGANTVLIQQLADALTASRIRVGVCSKKMWHDLCGETNIQSSSISEGVFIHIELDEVIRSNVDPLIKALVQVFDH